MSSVPPGRISSPALPAPGASLWTVTEFITTHPRVARAASLEEKVRIVTQLKEAAVRMERQEGGVLQKGLSSRAEVREQCVESQLALAILLETTLGDPVERDGILAALPGLAHWLADRMALFTNPRLRIIVERALSPGASGS